MIRVFQIITAIYVMLCCVVPATAQDRLTVFAAASLKTALDEVAQAYDGDVTLSYGGSGLLARQVAAGAPADLVILANADWMGWLAEGGHVQHDSTRDLLSNRLVVIGPVGAEPLALPELKLLQARLGDRRLAMGHRDSVPAGIYARQWLMATGLWQALSGQLAETENVRAALALVSRGEVPLGIVYATDAGADDRVSVLYDVPPDLHDKIRYPAAIITGGKADQAQRFLTFLAGDVAANLFISHGFTLAEEES